MELAQCDWLAARQVGSTIMRMVVCRHLFSDADFHALLQYGFGKTSQTFDFAACAFDIRKNNCHTFLDQMDRVVTFFAPVNAGRLFGWNLSNWPSTQTWRQFQFTTRCGTAVFAEFSVSLRMIVADSHYDLDIGTWKLCATILWLSPTSFFSRVSKHLFRLYVGRQKKQRITAWTNIGNKQRYYFPTWDDRKKERQWIGCRKCGPFNCSYVEAKIAPKSVTTNLFHFCATLVHKPLKLNFLEEKHPKTKRSFASLAWRIRLPFLKTCVLNRWNGLYPTRVLKVSDRVGFISLFDFLRLQNDYAQFCMWAL